MKVKVLSPFSSRFNPKAIYEKDSVYDFPEARAKELIAGGFAEESKEKAETISIFEKEYDKKVVVDALKVVGENVVWNIKEETLIAKISALDEDKKNVLKTTLGITS